jgi:hypothetical protein
VEEEILPASDIDESEALVQASLLPIFERAEVEKALGGTYNHR